MPNDFKDTLAKLLRLVIGQNGYLKKSTDRAVAKTFITVEEYIDRRMTAGATDKQIFDELMEDLESETSRVFGQYQTEMKGTVYGAANIAGSNGSTAKIIANMRPEERGTRLLRWQANGKNVCEDCMERHGQEDTLEGWVQRGMPSQFGSRCGENCQCTLTATDVILEPIRVGV